MTGRRAPLLFLGILLCVPAARAAEPPYDAVIVLGSGAPPEGWANPLLVERVCRAAAEKKAGRARRLIVSGGYTAGHIAEAEMMRAVAVAMGVPAGDVLLEDSSVNTAENAAFSLRVARAAGIRRAALVTHRSHLGRATELFDRAGGGYWSELGGIEADGALSPSCFPPGKPLGLGSTVDMLIVDVTDDQPFDDVLDRPADIPGRPLVDMVLAAGEAYRSGLVRRIYFAEPVPSTSTATASRGSGHGHISRTELARMLASAQGAAWDDIYISSGRRFGQIPGAVEPAEDPWMRIPGARLAVWAPAQQRGWWEDYLRQGRNADLPKPIFLD